MHQTPQGESIWGTINSCIEIVLNIYMIVAVDQEGNERTGIMARKDTAKDTLSAETVNLGEEDGEWLCYDESANDIPMYEILQRQMAACKRVEKAVMEQMKEMKDGGNRDLMDYFGECQPPEEGIQELRQIRNGIYMGKDGANLKFAVHQRIANSYMTPMAMELGQKRGDYFCYDMDHCAVVFHELKHIFHEVENMVLEEDSLHATLQQNFHPYVELYDGCMPECDRIPEVEAPTDLFLAVQLEDEAALQEFGDIEQQREEQEDFGEQVYYGIEP